MTNLLTPALFLDRDGVIHREIGYLSRPEQVEFMPGIFDLCRDAQSNGYRIVVVTNQSGIARELYSEEEFHAVMRWMVEQFARKQVRLDGYYFCPHHPEFGAGRYRKECPNRKPHPGMILQAAQELGIDLRRSILVGDRDSDLEAGAAAGVGKLVLLEGTESGGDRVAPGHVVVGSLLDVRACLRSFGPLESR